MSEIWINVFLSGRDSRLCDNELMWAILLALSSNRGTITPTSEMHRFSHCVSIKVNGTGFASYYHSAEMQVQKWRYDMADKTIPGLPFDRNLVFPKKDAQQKTRG